MELSNAERGVYVTLVNLIYAHGGAVTESKDWPRIFRCHSHTLNAALSRLETLGKIDRNGSQISPKRCSNELQRSSKRLAKQSQNLAKARDTKGLDVNTGGQKNPPTVNQRIKEPRFRFPPLPSGEIPPEGDQPQEKQDGRRRGRQLQTDWTPGEAGFRFALERGLTVDEINEEFGQFRDHHLRRGSRMRDWQSSLADLCRKGYRICRVIAAMQRGNPAHRKLHRARRRLDSSQTNGSKNRSSDRGAGLDRTRRPLTHC